MVLTDDSRQVDLGLSEAGQYHPVVFEQLRLLRLRGASVKHVSPCAMEFPMYADSANSGSFLR
jgi:hypothetical protein